MTRLAALTRNLNRATVAAAFIGLVIGAASGASATSHYLHRPATVVSMIELNTRVTHRGGNLDLLVDKIDNKACLVVAVRWLWRQDPLDASRNQWVSLGTPYSPPAIGQEASMRISIPVPNTVEDGDWNYLGIYRDVCEHWWNAGDELRFSPNFPVHIDGGKRD